MQHGLTLLASSRGGRLSHLLALVFAADHGLAHHSVSLYPARVGGQVAEAAARGETAIGVLARAIGAELVVASVGLIGAARRGLVNLRVSPGSADTRTATSTSEAGDQLPRTPRPGGRQ